MNSTLKVIILYIGCKDGEGSLAQILKHLCIFFTDYFEINPFLKAMKLVVLTVPPSLCILSLMLFLP